MQPTGRPRRTPSAGPPALVLAVSVAVLAACSGGGSPSASGSSSARTSSPAAETTPAGPTGADAVFCQQVSQLVTELATVQSAPPEQVPALLGSLVANVDKVQPPAAIASDWQALASGLHQLQSALGSVDVTAPEGQAQLEQLAAQTTAAAAGPQGTITAWVLSNCGSGGPATSSSAAGSS